MVLNDVVDQRTLGEPLASVLAGRDPKTLTGEQVVKNYLRTAFDKLGVWTRLELALYVAGHGGANWHGQWAAALRGHGRAWTRHINFRAAQQSKKSPPQAEGSCKESRDASVERRASRLHQQSFLHHWISHTR
jgi:hypothetical protein